jgi:hypothetical protein
LNEINAEDLDFGNVKNSWCKGRMKQVEQFHNECPDWKIENGRMYHLRLDQLGKVISGTVDKWKLVVPLHQGLAPRDTVGPGGGRHFGWNILLIT